MHYSYRQTTLRKHTIMYQYQCAWHLVWLGGIGDMWRGWPPGGCLIDK